MHYGISDDSAETFSVFLFVIECYSESEQEDPEIAVETRPPHYSAETLSPLVRTVVIGLLVIDQMCGCRSFQLGRNYLD